MKITAISTRVVNARMRNWVFVKVETDEGITGWGEASLEWKTRGVVGCVEDLAPLLDLEFGLRDAASIYRSRGHLEATAVALTRERLRRARIGLDPLRRLDPGVVVAPLPGRLGMTFPELGTGWRNRPTARDGGCKIRPLPGGCPGRRLPRSPARLRHRRWSPPGRNRSPTGGR